MKKPLAPDCKNCIHLDTCPRFKAGSFCTSYQTKAPQCNEKDDPNAKWRRGEDVDF